jgi:hypothetical protein
MEPRTADVKAMNMGGQDASKKKKRIYKCVMAHSSEHYDSGWRD